MNLPSIWFERHPVAEFADHVRSHVTVLGPASETPDLPFSQIGDALGIVAGSFRYSGDVMDLAPRLLVIGRTGIGVDSVDIAGATERGVAVCNAPAAPTISTGEHAVMLLLAAAKRLERGQKSLREGAPDPYVDHHGVELAGKRLALVGFGRIARRVARVALALEMEVVAFDPYAAESIDGVSFVETLEELVSDAEAISVHVPLMAETAHMFDDGFFGSCRPGVVFVNTARGGLVDHDALLRALDAGVVGAAGLDVTEPEPLPTSHPLLLRDDVVVTPHIATATADGRRKNFEGGYLQVLDVIAGRRPPHLVNPAVWPTVLDRLQATT